MSDEPIVDEVEGEILDDAVAPAGAPDCERCDFLERRVEAHERRSDGMAQDIVNLQRVGLGRERIIAQLKTELEKQRVDDPEFTTAKAIYARWVDETGRNPKTTKFTEKRQKAVLARLKQYADEFVLWGVVGGVRAANVSNKEAERLALIATMHETVRLLEEDPDGLTPATLRAFYKSRTVDMVRYDELELICRDGINLERGYAAAVRMGAVPADVQARLEGAKRSK